MLRGRLNCFSACRSGGEGGDDVFAGSKGASGRFDDEAKGKPKILDYGGGDGMIKRLEWKDVESLTCGFTTAVVGEGGFSTVYIAGGTVVKVHRSSERLRRVFLQELDALRRLRHPHIVRLLAYCDGGQGSEDGALVLEFAANGNLHEKLHGEGAAVMPWTRRVAVALQVARALQFLHDECDVQIVHGDVKASNVLLDAAMSAKLCDFGSARLGFSAVVRPRHAMFGSPGYVDPHYLRSGVVTAKTDVYSFGVLLLEVVTGKQPFCADKGAVLAAAVGSSISCADVADIVDPRLAKDFDTEEAHTAVAMAARCVGDNPSLRPTMSEVVRTLERKMHVAISTVGC